MPCDTVTTATIDAGKMPVDTLRRGLEADGHTVSLANGKLVWYDRQTRQGMEYNPATGQVTVSGRTIAETKAVAAVKQSFSRQLVRDQAKRYGWQLEQQGNTFKVRKATR